MGKIISIIIPSYNMELYLRRCVESLIIPSLDDVEIIIVNDGSKDNTSQIGHDFESKYPESVKVIDKENGNYGSCINAGLKMATGEYIKILDADDFFDTNSFQSFVEKLQYISAEVVLTNFNHIDGNNLQPFYGRNLSNVKFPGNRLVDLKVASRLLDYPLMHLITYKRNLLQSISYKQTEGASYTDTEWCFIPFAMARSFLYLPINLYQYVIGREGQTVSPSSWLKSNPSYFKILWNMVRNYTNIIPKCDRCQNSYLKNYLDTVYHSVMLRNLNSKDPKRIQEFKEFDNRIKTSFPEQYNEWSKIRLSKWSKWPIVYLWRQSDYSVNFNVPTIVRFREKILKNWYRIRHKLSSIK